MLTMPKKKEVNILKVQTESFASSVSRTLAAYDMKFFVTLAFGWKLAAKNSFLEHRQVF